MSQKNSIIPRTCSHCKQQITSDAKGIKAHAEECSKERKEIISRMKSPVFVHGQVGE